MGQSLEEVTYCGLYCGLCANRRRIREQARALRATLRREGYDLGYIDVPGVAEVFAGFWEGLNRLAENCCPGCRGGGGNPGCAVRSCASERGIVVCPLCEHFPCGRLDALRAYPLLVADGWRMREIGLGRWIAEQEARAATGFAYVDVRFPADVSDADAGERGNSAQGDALCDHGGSIAGKVDPSGGNRL